MPVTANANQMSLVHAGSTGISSIFPDVCKTPSPGGPIPLPYPNIAQSSDTADGSSTVKVDGNPIMLKGSNFRMSTGDEAGSAMGVVSNKIKGKAEPLLYSFDVKVDGKNVMRLTDMMLQNVGTPNPPPGTEAQGPVLGAPLNITECKKTEEKKDEQKKTSTSWGNSGIVGEHKGPIQTAATNEEVVLYFRQTKAVCGKWISLKHRPKPHSCMSGTTIKGEDVPKVQAWLDDHFRRMHPTQLELYPPAAPPEAGSRFYSRHGGDYVGIIGIGVGGGKIKPVIGSGTQTVSYENKWMTGDYDLFECVKLSKNCEKVTGDDFAKIKKAVNTGCSWDAIQHAAQAQWVPDEHEQEQGVAKFDMNQEVKSILRGKKPLDHAINWRSDRKPMPVLDAPLTVVSGNGVVTLDKKKDVKQALVCQGCKK